MASQLIKPISFGFMPMDVNIEILRSYLKEAHRLQLSGDEEKAQEYKLKANAQYKMIKSLASLMTRKELASLLEGSGKAERFCYDCEGKEDLPGKLIRHEGDPEAKDKAENDMYEFAGKQGKYWSEVHGWHGWDGNFADDLLCAHYGWQWSNAAFTGKYMIFGDGNKELFKTFILRSVMYHEKEHGATAKTAGLIYKGQPGILNEAFSDIGAAMCEMWEFDTTVDLYHWLIGKGIWADEDVNPKDQALRNMRFPGTAYNNPMAGKDRQTAHMKDYKDEDSDNGGVHKHSGIVNGAVADGCLAIGGHVVDNGCAHVLWVTRTRLESNAGFQDFADTLLRVSIDRLDARRTNLWRDALKGRGFTPTV